MTIKQWNIDPAWQEPFVAALHERGANPQAVGHALQHVDNTLAATGRPARDVFGDPRQYASGLVLSGSKSDRRKKKAARSRAIAIAVALLGLIGMFLTLWGWTGMQRDVHHIAGMKPVIPFVVGAVLTLGAALFDTAMGAKSDVFVFERGQRPTAMQTFVNKFAPWVIVLLTALGVLIIWLQNR